MIKTLIIFAAALLLSGGVVADSPGRLLSKAAPGCYCRCARGGMHSGCVKMCELPKYASRWWAKSCKRQRPLAPAENHDAGPRLHHREHAERAKL